MNRHVEALAEEFLGRGHHVRVLAPFDPPGRLSRVAHRAAPEGREPPESLMPLGRSVGIGANGAVSNLAVLPRHGIFEPRRELRRRDKPYDVIHIHEPIVPLVGEDNIIWGADYPHPDCIWPNSHATLAQNLAAFPPAVQKKITYDNVTRLYGLN